MKYAFAHAFVVARRRGALVNRLRGHPAARTTRHAPPDDDIGGTNSTSSTHHRRYEEEERVCKHPQKTVFAFCCCSDKNKIPYQASSKWYLVPEPYLRRKHI